MTWKSRSGLALALVTTGLGVASSERHANAATSSDAAPVTPRVHGESALRCHLEMTVRLRAGRFQSTKAGIVSCAGQLLREPITAVTYPRVSGRARHIHHGSGLPPVFGTTVVQLNASGPSGPLALARRAYTPVKLTLVPAVVHTVGAGHYSGTVTLRNRAHQAAATIAFHPTRERLVERDCCKTGQLVVDLTLSDVAA